MFVYQIRQRQVDLDQFEFFSPLRHEGFRSFESNYILISVRLQGDESGHLLQ